MWAYEIQGSFGLSNLKRVERTQPSAGPGQVVVEMRAASLNFRDLLTVQGIYNPRQKLPLVPLSDGAGVVVERGPGAERFSLGSRVVASFAPAWVSGEMTRERFRTSLGGPNDGTLQARLLLPEDALLPIPEGWSFEEAATLPCAALTAYHALVGQAQLRAGETVVVQGTGGVALFALQIAKLSGARVILTSSSDEKLARGKAMGADELINYRTTPAWAERVRELTGKRGADLIVEVGGAGTLEQSIRAVRMGGTIALIGMLAGGAGPVNLVPVLMQNIRVQGVTVGHRELFEQLLRALVQGGVRPVIDRTFPVTDVHVALEWMRSGAHFGKICLRY